MIRRTGNFALRLWGAPYIETASIIGLYNASGLSLLYASGYFMPISRGGGAYLLPSHNVFATVVLPTLVLAILGSLLAVGISLLTRAWLGPRVATIGAVVILALLSLVALKGLLNAAGYEWQDNIPRGVELRASLLEVRLALFGAAALLIWVERSIVRKIARVLGSIGFAFTALLVLRIAGMVFAHEDTGAPVSALGYIGHAPHATSSTTLSTTPSATSLKKKARRVVWVVFDETDFRRTYGDESKDPMSLINFRKLADRSVFATNANSPASATLYSIPALLMGTPLSGQGVLIDKAANLSVESGGKLIPFRQEESVFAAVAAANEKASLLGFFHPYCKIFSLDRCDSLSWPEEGGTFDAVWANIPVFVASALGHPDPWGSVTEKTLKLLPEYMARDDALTFIHLNVPHPPATYADKYLHVPPSSDPLTEYSRNLLLSDHILGTIVEQLETQKDRYDLLLVVSSDHWLRNRWYRANTPETSRPILFSAWRVGDNAGTTIAQPLSTVNTAAMILRYLDGSLTTQTDIAQWWASQPVYPSFIAPNT